MRTVLLTMSALLITACNATASQNGQQEPQDSNERVSEAFDDIAPTREDAQQPLTAETYVQQAAMSDLFEIQSGRLALEQTASDQTRKFAQMMVDDHTKSSQNLKAAVGRVGANFVVPAALDAEHQGMLDRLASARDSSFDREYMNQQMTAHRKALALHQSYYASGDDAALREFAQKVIPVVQKHHDRLQSDAGGPVAVGSASTR